MGGKGGGNFARQKLSRKFSNFILAAAEMSKFDGSFSGQKNANTLHDERGVRCTWHMLTEGAWETFWRQMVWEVDGKVLAKFWATSTRERC